MKPLQGEGPPRRRLERMLEALDGLYAGGKNAYVLANLVVGGARHLFQRPLQTAFAAWVEGLMALAVEAGVPRRAARERAEDVVSSIEGALVLAGGLGDVNPFKRALRRVPELLLGPSGAATARP